MLHLIEHLLRDDNLSDAGRTLESRRQVNHRTYGGEIFVSGSDFSDLAFSGVYSYAYPEGLSVTKADLLFKIPALSLQQKSGIYRILYVVFPNERKIENGKHGITDELVDNSVFLPHSGAASVIESVQQIIQLITFYLL